MLRLALRVCLPLTLIAALAGGALTAAARGQPRSPWLTWVDPRGRILVWDGAVQAALTGPTDATITSLSWSPDGRLAWTELIRYDSQFDRVSLHIWGLDGAREIADRVEPPYVWSPDGGLIFSAWDDGSYDLFRYRDGSMTPISQRPGFDREPVVSPDGRIAWKTEEADGGRGLHVTDGSTTQRVFDGHVESGTLSWSQDGRLTWLGYTLPLTTLPVEYHVYLWDGAQTRPVTDEPGQYGWPRWSPDGRLAWSVHRGRVYGFVVRNGDETNFTPTDNAIVDIRWSNRNRLAIAIVNERPGYVDYAIWDDRGYVLVTRAAPDLLPLWSAPAWSNDGQLAWITFQSQRSTAALVRWDGEQIDSREPPQGIPFGWTWSDEGQIAWVARGARASPRLFVWDGAERIFAVSDRPHETTLLVWSPVVP